MDTTIITTWQDAGINYTLHSDNTVTSDKPEGTLKKLDPNSKSFVANGKVYMIERELSIDRWVKQQEFEIELGFGMSYGELKNNMTKIYNLSNDRGGRIGDIGRVAYDSVTGITKALERQPQVLKFCALFLNTVDEDRKTINDDQIAIKCDDFRKEGFAIDGFFVFALSLITDLAEDYKRATQNALSLASSMLSQTENP